MAITQALLLKPDVLLMDEPTNHLDLEGIIWLEQLLKNRAKAFLVISHDRRFLESVTSRMVELNRCYPEGRFESRGCYSDFLEQRDAALQAQADYQASLANRVRREVEWLRRGPKARSTKAKGRIQSAGKLIDELNQAESRSAQSTIGIDFSASGRKSKQLVVAEQVSIYIRDFQTGQRRTTNFQDNIDLLHVYNEMESASLVWPTTVHEFDPRFATVKTSIASFMHCSLHIQDELEKPEQVPLMIEALEAILGSADAVKERKIFSGVYCTLPPLGQEGNMCDAYLELLDYEVPICLYPMPSAGSTGPASLFSNIAMANAEALSALTLFQLAKPGRPIIMGDAPGSTDFRTGNFLEGSPEMVLQAGARGEMAKFYGLPNEQAGCLTDAKEHGAQAIMEKMLTTMPLVLSGADLIQGPGALDTSNMMSLEQIVVDDEIARVCQRLREGVDTSAEKDYFEDLAAVGPGGHFLGQRNTRKAAGSKEFVAPVLADRNPYSRWAALGRPDLYDKAREKVEEILSSPQKNPLPDDVIGKLEATG